MDPLSIVASIIAVVGVGGKAAKAVRRLAALRDAPDLMLALNNEISDLCLAAQAVQDILQEQLTSHQPMKPSVKTSITNSLQLANDQVGQLEAFYQRLLRSSPVTGVPIEVNKSMWLRERKHIKKLQHKFHNVRVNLWISLGLLISYVQFDCSVPHGSSL